MGGQARRQSRADNKRRQRENDRAGEPKTAARVLVQTEFPTEREHAGKKSVRRLARLWVKP
jgi:hypothetical protein